MYRKAVACKKTTLRPCGPLASCSTTVNWFPSSPTSRSFRRFAGIVLPQNISPQKFSIDSGGWEAGEVQGQVAGGRAVQVCLNTVCVSFFATAGLCSC